MFILQCSFQPVNNKLAQRLLTINIQILRFNTLHSNDTQVFYSAMITQYVCKNSSTFWY